MIWARWWYILLVLIALGGGPGWCADGEAPEPDLTILCMEAPPLCFQSGGDHAGLAVDVVTEIMRRLKVAYPLSFASLPYSLERARQDPLTLLMPIWRTPAREGQYQWVGPLVTERLGLYARRGSGLRPASLDEAKAVGSIAAVAGHASGILLKKLGFTNLVSCRGPGQCADSLKFGRVDLWLASDLTMAASARRAGVDPQRFELVYVVREFPAYLAFSLDTPASLVDLWQKTLERLKTDGTFAQIMHRWLPPEHRPPDPSGPLGLTPEEKAWLAQHPTIRYGVDPNWPPFDFTDARGRHQGMAWDFIRLLGQRLGVNFVLKPDLEWHQVVAQVKDRRLDIVPCMVPTKARQEFLTFTEPYLSFPSVIITRSEHPFISGLADLYGSRVAVVKGYFTQDRLQRDFPQISLLETIGPEQALEMVSLGRADAYVGNLVAATYLIRREGLTNLKVAARTAYHNDEISIGVRKDWPELVGILNKGLDSISLQEREAIHNRWISVRFEHEVDTGSLWRLAFYLTLAAAGVLVLVFLRQRSLKVWNQRLQDQIDERNRAESALRASEERFRLLAQNSSDIIFIIDHDEAITYVSDSVMRIAGYQPENLQGRPIMEGVHPEDTARVRGLLDGLRERPGESIRAEYRFRRIDGEWVYLEVVAANQFHHPRLGGIVLNARDITERRRAERELQESEGRYRTLVEESFDGIYVHKGSTITFANRQLNEMLGYRPGELEGKPHWELFDQPYQELARRRGDRRIAGERLPTHYLVRIRRKDGSALEAELHARMVSMAGEPAVQVSVRDISDAKRSQEEMLERERLQSAIETAGAACHELNQPLQTVSMQAELALLKLEPGHPARPGLEALMDQVNRLSEVTHRLNRITTYRTKPYLDGANILDLDRSSDRGGGDRTEG